MYDVKKADPIKQFSYLQSSGGVDAGGGDPAAVDFLLSAKTFGKWVTISNIGLNDTEIQNINGLVVRLAIDMNDQNKTPIKLVDQEIKDKSGTIKVAFYSKKPLSIYVNRSRWNSLNPKEKFITVGLELLGLIGLGNRYDVAGLVSKSFGAISSIHGDTQLLNFIIGSWHLKNGYCLSGAPVNWGGNFSDADMQFKFKSDLSFSLNLNILGKLRTRSIGTLLVKDANLRLTTDTICNTDNYQEVCENGDQSESTSLLTIQNNQIWMLSNQGEFGGSCPTQDVFQMILEKVP